MKDKIEVVAFDADDTLWENEVYFQEFEHQFCDLLKAYQPQSAVSQELFKTEMKNLHMYGYGLKSMMLSMIETACRITGGEGNMRERNRQAGAGASSKTRNASGRGGRGAAPPARKIQAGTGDQRRPVRPKKKSPGVGIDALLLPHRDNE